MTTKEVTGQPDVSNIFPIPLMDALTPFTFLHQETILTQFRIFAENLAKILPPDCAAAKAIDDQLKTLAKNQGRWPRHVCEKSQSR